MSQSEFNEDRYYEILNEAILNAITSSDEVKDILVDFKSKKLINNLAVLNLILSLEELSELIFKPESSHMYKLEPTKSNQIRAIIFCRERQILG
jgi:argininosuccinate synthase